MIIKNELYNAVPIFDSGLTDDEISSFSVKRKEGQGLVNYLYGYAESDEQNNVMRTYIVRDNITNELVGYFSLKAGMISMNELKIGNKEYFDTRPGIELANFAINNAYTSKHLESKGCGMTVFFDLIIPIITDVADKVGVKMIYIFSLPIESLMSRYSKYGFKRLNSKQEEELHKRLKPKYDESCIFMYQEL